MIAQDGSTRVQEVLASNLRRLRVARHLSLSGLARATGTSKATLSSIERARCNPTVDTLASLAGALRVSFRELLEELPPGEVRVVRASQRRAEPGAAVSRLTLDRLAPPATGSLVELVLQPRQLDEPPPQADGTRAHVFVLQGELIAGPVEQVTELSAGDYVSFRTDVPHLYESRRQPARALVLSQGPA
jgi:XRE family transcriptional regulator, regulator of sulfur utilization